MKLHFYKAIFLAVICVPVVTNLSCKKKNVDPPPSGSDSSCSLKGVYKVIVRAVARPGDTLAFDSDAPACASRLWIFRHENQSEFDTSTELTPKYVYSKIGTYEVALVINGDKENRNDHNAFQLIRISNPYNPAELMKLNGLRDWDVQEDSMDYTKKVQTVRIKNYTEQFALSFLNDSLVIFKNDTLKASLSDIAYGITYAYTFEYRGQSPFKYATMYYYPRQDSVALISHPSQGGVPASGNRGARPYGITYTYLSRK